MKYLATILTIIAVMLLVLGWKLYDIGVAVKSWNEESQLIVRSNQALIQANARLENEIVSLAKQIEAVKESFSKR